MKALMLGACLAAVLGAPALAQPYGYDQGGGYQDQRDPYYDQDQSQGQTQDQYDRGYGNDRYDDNDRYNDSDRYNDNDRHNDNDRYGDDRYGDNDRGYDQDNDYGRYGGQDWRAYGEGVPPGAHFTGRTGASWRNADGQTCTWREMTWTDRDGGAAYRWTQRCHS